jgi:hypothetical protein
MSTKREENCPRCGTATMPTDKPLAVDIRGADIPVRMWRYECAVETCGHAWSNLQQREHNALAYRAARKLEYAGYFG